MGKYSNLLLQYTIIYFLSGIFQYEVIHTEFEHKMKVYLYTKNRYTEKDTIPSGAIQVKHFIAYICSY